MRVAYLLVHYVFPDQFIGRTVHLQLYCVPLRVAHFLGKAEEAAHGVGARGEDKHERSGVGHVLVESGQCHWRTLHKLWTEVAGDKVYCSKHHLKTKMEPSIQWKQKVSIVHIYNQLELSMCTIQCELMRLYSREL